MVSETQEKKWFCLRYSSDIYGENTKKDKHIQIYTESHHGCVVVERSPCMGGGVRGLVLGRNIPKSLTHVVAGPLPNARRQCDCDGSFEMTIIKG